MQLPGAGAGTSPGGPGSKSAAPDPAVECEGAFSCALHLQGSSRSSQTSSQKVYSYHESMVFKTLFLVYRLLANMDKNGHFPAMSDLLNHDTDIWRTGERKRGLLTCIPLKLWKDISIVRLELFAADTDALCGSGKGPASTCSGEGEGPHVGDVFPVLGKLARFPWV